MPVVSVVITTYRRPNFLARALASVLAQSFREFEVIVVDDAPNESSKNAVAGLLRQWPAVTYHQNLENLGGGASRNVGLAQCSGEFVTFLDDDDIWLPDRLLLGVRALGPSTVWSSVGWEWREDTTARREKIRVADANGRIAGLPRWMHNIAVDFIVERQTALSLPTSETLQYYIPMELVCRLTKLAMPVFVQEPLISCRTHPGERTSTRPPERKLSDMVIIRNAHHDLFAGDRRADAWFSVMEGALLEQANRQVEATAAYARAMTRHPDAKTGLRLVRSSARRALEAL